MASVANRHYKDPVALTEREKIVSRMLAERAGYAEIAAALGVKINTVSQYMSSIREKERAARLTDNMRDLLIGLLVVTILAVSIAGRYAIAQPAAPTALTSNLAVTINQDLNFGDHAGIANVDVCGTPGQCFAFQLAAPPAGTLIGQFWVMIPNANCTNAAGPTTVNVAQLGPLPIYLNSTTPMPAGGCTAGMPVLLMPFSTTNQGVANAMLAITGTP